MLTPSLEPQVGQLVLCWTPPAIQPGSQSGFLQWPLSGLDIPTLLGCQCLLAVLFAAVFFWMGHTYPSLRGIRSVATSILIGVPESFLLLARGNIPDLFSINLADLLVTAVFVLLYDGVVLFVEGNRKTLWLAAAALAANAIVFYSSPAQDPAHANLQANIVPRILAMTLFCGLLRGFIAWELLRHSLTARHSTSTAANNRTAMRFLGVVMAFAAIAGLLRGLARGLSIAAQAAPQTYLDSIRIQSSDMLANVAYLGVFGLSFLLMSGHELIARSQEESEKDLLSGAFNRRGIESRLATELKRYSRSHQALTVALLDIDHFKAINDIFGHASGDAAIRNIAYAIARSLRDSDYLGRYGGDEFLIVLPITPARQAIHALDRLTQAVAAIPLPAGARPLTLSIGLTEACQEDDPATLIARADEALYRAKTDGRDRHHTLLPLNPSINLEIPRQPRPQTRSQTHPKIPTRVQ